MSFHGRAFYNLLQMHGALPNQAKLKPWQLLDYRKVDTSTLVRLLKEQGIDLNPEEYPLYASKAASPEEITLSMFEGEDDPEQLEKGYLVLFELWRRLCPDIPALSIFCDELDYQIARYDDGVDNEELLQQMLKELEDILDQNADHGGSPLETFQMIKSFMAHDLESFIYDFAKSQLNKQNDLYASELVDGFYEYVERKTYFDFLRICFVASVDVEEATIMMEHLIEKMQENPDIELLFEILSFLTYQEGIPLFHRVFELVSELLQIEGEFQDLLEILMEYFNTMDLEDKENTVRDIFLRRSFFARGESFSQKDADLLTIKKALKV